MFDKDEFIELLFNREVWLNGLIALLIILATLWYLTPEQTISAVTLDF